MLGMTDEMKVLFILENTIESLEGGTEVSSFYLARLLRERGVEAEEWAPYKKRKSMYFYTAPLFQLWIFLILLLKIVKTRTQILHIQGKYLIPPAVWIGKILKISTVATIRDYIVVCPIGLCLFEIKREENHDFWFYLNKEVPYFLQLYHFSDSVIKKWLRRIFLVRGWFVSRWLNFWLKQADTVVSVSKVVQKILEQNGISSQVIHNSFDVSLCKEVRPHKVRPFEAILFVGKPSYGKGYDLFVSLARMKEFNRYEFKMIGGDNKLSYMDTLKEIKNALVVVIPSRWSEPFGRVALESLMLGTPVVAARRGGLPEIVADGITGFLVEPTVVEMTNALKLAIKQNQKLRQGIGIQKKSLTKRFGSVPLKLHLDLYTQLLDKIHPK